MATKESVHRRLLDEAAFWQERADIAHDHFLPHEGDRLHARSKAFEEAAELVGTIDSFEQEEGTT